MSFPFPYHQDQPGDSSSIKSAFLTPPLTPLSAHEQPWRPVSADDSGLNMKKSHHKHDSQDQKIVPGQQEQDDQHNIRTARRRTPSNMRRSIRKECVEIGPEESSGSVSPSGSPLGKASTAGNESLLAGEPVSQRRWTLASKSQATRGFTPLRSTVKQTTIAGHVDSPAVITLRRATTKVTPKVDELTFFPEPTFSHEKTGLLSYLVSTFSLVGSSDDTNAKNFPPSKGTSRSTSLDSNGVHPTMTNPAATVCTETTVDARLMMPGNDTSYQHMRRCSTRFTSGSTSYEVIWDENDSASAGEQSRSSTAERRRSSMAVTSLEAQLARSTSSTPHAFKINSSRASRNSVGMFQEQILTPAKLDQIILPRLQHKTGLRDLPRSRGGRRKRSSTVCSITVEEGIYQTLSDDNQRRPSTFAIDFFPPITSRRQSNALDQDLETPKSNCSGTAENKAHANSIFGQYRPRLGSLIGSSGHARRASSAIIDNPTSHGKSKIRGVMGRLGSFASDSWFGEVDTEPLLGTSQE